MARGQRKPGEPIYLRHHIISLTLAVGLPLVLLQLYKIYIGPIDFGIQLLVVVITSVFAGAVLYLTYRSSAKNQP
ncbi:MAG: hypothetical protein HP491_15705 [Nitrospira sp.]|nr:hypothetical protein [Nitrospira sp.]MBH0185645.1 hypothetical protein [Nitrospira sp.]